MKDPFRSRRYGVVTLLFLSRSVCYFPATKRRRAEHTIRLCGVAPTTAKDSIPGSLKRRLRNCRLVMSVVARARVAVTLDVAVVYALADCDG
jgi:hypothetical protein